MYCGGGSLILVVESNVLDYERKEEKETYGRHPQVGRIFQPSGITGQSRLVLRI